MNKLVEVFIVGLVVFVGIMSNSVFGQSCNPDWYYEYYAYEYDDEAGKNEPLRHRCSKDPAAEAYYPDIQIFKGTKICINKLQIETAEFTNGCDPDFNMALTIEESVDAIISQLNSVCTSFLVEKCIQEVQSPCPPEDCIRVAVSDRDLDFGNLAAGQDPGEIPGISRPGYTDDKGEHKDPFVLLNVSARFFEKKHNCFSADCDEHEIWASDGGTLYCYCVQAMLLHEILHCYGLAHPGGVFDYDNSTQDSHLDPCNDESTFPEMASDPMYYKAESHYCAGCISDYDKCALKALYCKSEMSRKLTDGEFKKLVSDPCNSLHTEANNAVIESAFDLYPTSAKNYVTLVMNHDVGSAKIYILESSGRIMHYERVDGLSTGYLKSLECGKYPSGFYSVVIEIPGKRMSSSFIITR
jgi:hypothetical protein